MEHKSQESGQDPVMACLDFADFYVNGNSYLDMGRE
jgi:hypothetical protein